MSLLKAAAVAGMCLSLAACATIPKITSAYQAITDASIPPQVVIVAGNSFDAMTIEPLLGRG